MHIEQEKNLIKKKINEETDSSDDLPDDLYVLLQARHEVAEDAYSLHSVSAATKTKRITHCFRKGAENVLQSFRRQFSYYNNLSLASNEMASASLGKRHFGPSIKRWTDNEFDATSEPIVSISKLHRDKVISQCMPCWSEIVSPSISKSLSPLLIKRQNIIHELTIGESETVRDLQNVCHNYRGPMQKLGLITAEDTNEIFFTLDTIIPMYAELHKKLESCRNPEGCYEKIGLVLLEWTKKLEPIVHYCAHLCFAKSHLEMLRSQPAVYEFLSLCIDSPFSRKLDIWDFLDRPRTRLMKYPIILENIAKTFESKNSEEYIEILLCVNTLKKLIRKLDDETGHQRCTFFMENFDFVKYNENISLVKNQKLLLMDGLLKTDKGAKIHAFLFPEVLVLTTERQGCEPSGTGPQPRLVGNFSMRYLVEDSLWPTKSLALQDLKDGEVKMGSFRSTLNPRKSSKNIFMLYPFELGGSNNGDSKSSSSSGRRISRRKIKYFVILQASDATEKHLWTSALAKEVAKVNLINYS